MGDESNLLQTAMEGNQQIMRDQFSPQADLYRAQAQGEQIKNRVAGLQLQFMQQLADADGDDNSGVSTPNVSDAGHGVQPTAMANLQAQYAPLPATPYSPAEIRTMQLAAMSGKPELADVVKLRHNQTLDAVNQQRAQQARQNYNDLYGVYTAPDGQALNVLSLIEPDAAARLKQMGASDDDVRAWAGEFAGTLHTAARLPATFREKDGAIVDGVTQEPVPGAHSALGLGPDQIKALTTSATELTDTYTNGVATKLPRWQVEGAKSARDWIQQHLNAAVGLRYGDPSSPLGGVGADGPSPTAGSGPAHQFFSTGSPGGATAPTAAPPPASTPPQASPPQQRRPSANALPEALQDWRMKTADPKIYADPDFRLTPPRIPPGQAMPPGVVDEQRAIAKSRTDLLDQQGDNSKAAGQALRYYSLASDVLNSGGVTTGWSQAHINQFSSALQQLGISSSLLGDPSKSAELVKALTNAGLQSLKSTYGSRVTQNEVFLNLEHANPNADMPLPALRRLINDQVQNLQYDISGSLRANRYLSAGGDPRKFDTWQQKYFPRERDAVTPQTPAGGSGSSAQAPVQVTSRAQAMALPPGTTFRTPDGRLLVR